MISLRQGKAKMILENSRDSVLTAVEIYNKPNAKFRIENYIVLMVIGWTKLFHAYFQATIGERYFYKEKNGRYKIVGGEKKAWELSECVNKYRNMNSSVNIGDAVVANLKFFIELRNRIEHRFWSGSELDVLLFGECQALLYNYENLLIGLFGEDYSINACLAYSLQFSHMRSNEQNTAQRALLSKDMQDIKRYIDKYKTDLPQTIYDSQEYSIKLLQIPKVSNTNRTDLAVEFVNWNSLNETDRENYRKVTTLIKDKLIIKSVSNANLLKPSNVVDAVKQKSGIEINLPCHTALWKAFRVRPQDKSTSKFATLDKYCVFDEPHNDYLYTMDWVDFICMLIKKYGFDKNTIYKKCKSPLCVEDFI